MGREVRRVPANWKHPYKGHYDDGQKNYVSLMDGADYAEHLARRKEEGKNWREYYDTKKEYLEYKPKKENYHPTGEWYQLFQTVSEGCPISPPFATADELVTWLVNNKDYWGDQWTEKAVRNMIDGMPVMSGVFQDGKMYGPTEQYKIQ